MINWGRIVVGFGAVGSKSRQYLSERKTGDFNSMRRCTALGRGVEADTLNSRY